MNYSKESPGGATVCSWAVELFSKLGIINELDLDAIVELIWQSQMSNGGFIDHPCQEPPPLEYLDLIVAESALFTVHWLNRINEIDTVLALDFILSCYKGGGFSYTPISEIDVGATPLGLLSLSYLGGLNNINREEVIAFVLSNYDNAGGHAKYEAIVETERLIWSLDLLDALDRIDQDAVVDWVLRCQSTWQGAFIASPDSDPILDERLEFVRAALHILQILGRLDVLDEEISLIMRPKHTIPQAYYDFIDEHFPGTTTSRQMWTIYPNINIIAFLTENAIPLTIAAVLLSPIGLACYADRVKRIERARQKKRRRKGTH